MAFCHNFCGKRVKKRIINCSLYLCKLVFRRSLAWRFPFPIQIMWCCWGRIVAFVFLECVLLNACAEDGISKKFFTYLDFWLLFPMHWKKKYAPNIMISTKATARVGARVLWGWTEEPLSSCLLWTFPSRETKAHKRTLLAQKFKQNVSVRKKRLHRFSPNHWPKASKNCTQFDEWLANQWASRNVLTLNVNFNITSGEKYSILQKRPKY